MKRPVTMHEHAALTYTELCLPRTGTYTGLSSSALESPLLLSLSFSLPLPLLLPPRLPRNFVSAERISASEPHEEVCSDEANWIMSQSISSYPVPLRASCGSVPSRRKSSHAATAAVHNSQSSVSEQYMQHDENRRQTRTRMAGVR